VARNEHKCHAAGRQSASVFFKFM